MNSVNWPTERHKKFAEHVISACVKDGIGLMLKGSIAQGLAKEFSDIDFAVYGNVSEQIIESIIYGFEKPLMVNASENPLGLLIVAYSHGFALDLEIDLTIKSRN